MHLKKTVPLFATLLLSMAGCAGEGLDDAQSLEGLKGQEASAESCVNRFDGITSCATGRAQLTANAKGIQVSGLRDVKTDGVSSNFSQGVKWSQTSEFSLGAQGSMTLAARDGSQVVSTLRVAPGREANSVQMLPAFSGSAGASDYRMNIYNGGVLQGSSSQPAGMMITFYNWRDFIAWARMHSFFLQDFDIIYMRAPTAPEVGACVWRMKVEGNTFTVNVDGKRIVGDEVEFIEKIGEGAYPYMNFSGIDMKATATSYNILSESIETANGPVAK